MATGARDHHGIESHWARPVASVGHDHPVVVLNAAVKVLEGIDGLLEHLDHRYAAHIFDRFSVHLLKGIHVLAHEFPAGGVHHVHHCPSCDDQRNHAGQSELPVDCENQNRGDHRNEQGSGEIRQLVRQKGVGDACVVVDNLAYAPARGAFKESKGHFYHPLHSVLAYVGLHAEGCEMRGHQGEKVENYAGDRGYGGPYRETYDSSAFGQTARDKQLPDYEPYQNVGNKSGQRA